MQTRPAVMAEIPEMLKLAEEFHALSSWKDKAFDASQMEQTLVALMDADEGVLFYNGAGFLGGVLQPVYFSNGTVAQELFWFARRGGNDLLKAFEDWATERGAQSVIMLSLAIDERRDRLMSKIYERKGYKLKERVFCKEL